MDAFGLSEGDYWGGPEKYKDKRKGLVYNNDVKPMTCPVYSLALMKPTLEDSLVIGYVPTLDSPDYFVLYIDVADVNVDGLIFYLGTKHLVKKCHERDLHDGDTVLAFNNNSNKPVLMRYRKEDGKPLEQGGLVVIGYIASMQLKPTPSSVLSNFMMDSSK